jgi:hypothetical protein
LSLPFYGYNRPGAKVSEGVRESFWLQGMMAGFQAAYFCIKAFSETDQTEDLKKFDVPTLNHAGRRRPDRAVRRLVQKPSSDDDLCGRHSMGTDEGHSRIGMRPTPWLSAKSGAR